MYAKPQKPVIWIGSSLRDLRKLQAQSNEKSEHALHMEEIGERSHKAKRLKGFSGVIELSLTMQPTLIEQFMQSKLTTTSMSCPSFKKNQNAVLQPQTRSGYHKKTFANGRTNRKGKQNMSENSRLHSRVRQRIQGPGDLTAQGRRIGKINLAIQINKIIHQKGWTQKKSRWYSRHRSTQVSALKNGRLGGFSIERLLSFLRALDRDIDIGRTSQTEDVAHIQVAEAINRPRYVTR